MPMKGMLAGVLLAGLAWAAPSQAQEDDAQSDRTDQAGRVDRTGWYAGAAFGRTDYGSEPAPGQYRSENDYTARSYSAFGGYRFGRHFALEAGHADLGGYRFVEDCPPDVICLIDYYPFRFDLAARQWEVAAVGILPLGRDFELYAKAGRARIQFEIESAFPNRFSTNNHSYDATWGVGARYHVGRNWAVRLQADRAAHFASSSVDITSYWLGLEYGFGR